MSGLILKDLFSLKRLWFKKVPVLLTIILLIGSLVWLKGSGTVIAIIFLGMVLINSLQTLFLADRADNWLSFLKTLNISTLKIVVSRYVVALLVTGLIALITFFSELLLKLLGSLNLPIFELGALSLVVLGVAAFYIIFLIPFIYLFNQNGLTVGIIVMVAGVYGSFELLPIKLMTSQLTHAPGLVVVAVGLGILTLEFLISIGISDWIMRTGRLKISRR